MVHDASHVRNSNAQSPVENLSAYIWENRPTHCGYYIWGPGALRAQPRRPLVLDALALSVGTARPYLPADLKVRCLKPRTGGQEALCCGFTLSNKWSVAKWNTLVP